MDDITKEEYNRLFEIEEMAVSNYLNKIDFDISEHIIEADKKEWIALKWKINGECPSCGETLKDNCTCE